MDRLQWTANPAVEYYKAVIYKIVICCTLRVDIKFCDNERHESELVVAYLFKIFFAFYGTNKINTFFHDVQLLVLILGEFNKKYTLAHCTSKIRFNIIS